MSTAVQIIETVLKSPSDSEFNLKVTGVVLKDITFSENRRYHYSNNASTSFCYKNTFTAQIIRNPA